MLIQDCDVIEGLELAKAYATIFQKKAKKGQPPQRKGSSSAYDFRVQGKIAFDQKGNHPKKNAIRFLKHVTPCTTCRVAGQAVELFARGRRAPRDRGGAVLCGLPPSRSGVVFFHAGELVKHRLVTCASSRATGAATRRSTTEVAMSTPEASTVRKMSAGTP